MGVQTALLISAAVSAGATLLQARAANAAARSDIARYEDEKKYAALVALEDENNRNKQMNVTLSNNRVVAGAAGILDDSRSFLAIQQDVIDNAAKDIANIRLNKTIAQIFQDEGAAFFREIEREVLIDLAKLKNAVIALGGGTLLEVENLMLVQQTGIAICLTATPAETWKRIEDTEKRKLIVGSKTPGRVLSTTNQIYRRIESLMLIRKPGYEQSEIIIDTTNRVS